VKVRSCPSIAFAEPSVKQANRSKNVHCQDEFISKQKMVTSFLLHS